MPHPHTNRSDGPGLDGAAAKKCFGERLRRSREKAGMSQQQVAAKLGVSRVVIANYESGKSSPEPDRAVKVADILDDDAAEFLLLSSLQRGAQERAPDVLLLRTVNGLLGKCGRWQPRSAPTRGLKTHLSLLDFPECFTPMTVVVGDRREEEPKNVGDLFVFSASTMDDRWLLELGLPRDTEKLSDKVLMTAPQEWLEEKLGHRHLLCIGSPASNLFVRQHNDKFLFRFAISRETKEKWGKKWQEMHELQTPASLAAFRERSKPDLKQTMRLFKQPGFVDFNYAHLKLGIDPAENRDFAVVSLGKNPFAKREPFFTILAAGVHLPGTAYAVKFLADPSHFAKHPFGGILEVEVPNDDCKPHEVRWYNKIEKSKADWHSAGDLPPGYTPEELREKLTTRWMDAVVKRNLVSDVPITQEELEQHKDLIDQLAAARHTTGAEGASSSSPEVARSAHGARTPISSPAGIATDF